MPVAVPTGSVLQLADASRNKLSLRQKRRQQRYLIGHCPPPTGRPPFARRGRLEPASPFAVRHSEFVHKNVMGRSQEAASYRYWPYWLTAVLFVLQTVAMTQSHSLTGRLTLCDTLLFVIAMAYRVFPGPPNLGLVLHTAGFIAFEALVFVNLSHAMEMLYEPETDAHFSTFFVAVVILDVAVKSVLLCASEFPHMFSRVFRKLFLHYTATGATLTLCVLNAKLSKENNEYLAAIDPYVAIVVSLILSAIAIPQLLHLLPFIFCNIPEAFSVQNFKRDVEQKFSNATVLHMHVYRMWPSESFAIFLHLGLVYDQTEEQWAENAQKDIGTITGDIRSVLVKAGAEQVTIEPHIRSLSEGFPSGWTSCADAHCEVRNRTCCSNAAL
uniref:Ion_trans domain-containing protein n=1 Tax=Steinernema glaseri TaxID=37863 RepID=A0A1I7XX25_9BILA